MTADQTNLAPTCVNHPKVETRLTCSNCGDPICTRCMVTTAVGQKCPRCAKQSGRAKGNPEPQLLARAFGVGVAVAALGGVLLVAVPFAGLLLALAHGFLVGAAVRWAARRRTHTWLGLVAAAAVLVGLGGLVLVLGGNPFAGPAPARLRAQRRGRLRPGQRRLVAPSRVAGAAPGTTRAGQRRRGALPRPGQRRAWSAFGHPSATRSGAQPPGGGL